MGDKIEWGAEIAIDGNRPAWLTDNYCPIQRNCGGWPIGDYHTVGSVTWPSERTTAIKLPASHLAYTVIAWNEAHPDQPPFFPWGGGDEAPGDWEGGDVLFRDGFTLGDGRGRMVEYWGHSGGVPPWQIIGYRRTMPVSTPAPLDEAAQAAIALVERMVAGQLAFESVAEARRIADLPSFPKAVDPLLIEAREVAGRIALLWDDRAYMVRQIEDACEAALRRGIELGKEGMA